MKDSRVYIIHIRDCISRIEAYIAEGKTAFLGDVKTQDAVIRNLEILCESTQRLPEAWKVVGHGGVDLAARWHRRPEGVKPAAAE